MLALPPPSDEQRERLIKDARQVPRACDLRYPEGVGDLEFDERRHDGHEAIVVVGEHHGQWIAADPDDVILNIEDHA